MPLKQIVTIRLDVDTLAWFKAAGPGYQTRINQLLRDRLKAGESFDAIVLDPPKFAPTASHADRAARAYKDINRLALKLLRPGGLLLTFSCSGGIGRPASGGCTTRRSSSQPPPASRLTSSKPAKYSASAWSAASQPTCSPSARCTGVQSVGITGGEPAREVGDPPRDLLVAMYTTRTIIIV